MEPAVRAAFCALSGGGADLDELEADLLADPQLVRELARVWECPVDDLARRATRFHAAWTDDA